MPAKKTATQSEKENSSVFEHSDALNNKVARPYFTKKRLVSGCILLTLCVIVGIGLYYYVQNKNSQKLLKNPLLASEVEQETLISNVGKLTPLPTGEQPAVAKVTDINKLKGQPFFQKAKNGDYVLIYQKANEAILYDPDGKQILQIAPITTNNKPVQGASTTANQPTPASVTVALYNGTTITGLTKKVQQELVTKMPTVTVVQNTNAVKQDYTRTLVVDLTGKNAAAASQLAEVLNGSVGNLPSGEVKPTSADLLVILGGTVKPIPTP